MKVIGTGLSGLVGSRIVDLWAKDSVVEDVSLSTGVDITNKNDVTTKILESTASWVLHFAAKTDVDACEVDKSLGENGDTWKVNVLATQYVVDACKKSNKNLLYLSTDYVFRGDKDYYTETDIPNPQSWYAQTKYEGEKITSSLDNSLIVRIASPYCSTNSQKPDFVHAILNKLHKNEEITAPYDQLFTPTFIDDIAHAIQVLISAKASGIYHVVGSQSLSPFESARKIANTFKLNASIKAVSHSDYFYGRAPRPLRAVLKNDKIQKLGLKISTFDQGLTIIKQQMN